MSTGRSGASIARWCSLTATLGLFCAAMVRAQEAEPRVWTLDRAGERRPAVVQPAPDVHDAVFAVLAGLLDENGFGTLTHSALDSLVTAAGGSRIPYGRIRSIEREPRTGSGRSTIRIEFGHDVRIPVPYSILGYHPGSMVASREVVLQECAMGSQTFRFRGDHGVEEIDVDDLHLFGVSQGSLAADVDAFFDWLMGDRADDVDISGLLLLRMDGHRYGVAFGYNHKHQGRSGVFDLTADQFVFPAPRPFLVMGRTMRERWEHAVQLGLWPCGGR